LPRQHFDHGRVRAAENGVPMVRACNTGVTGWVDCFGQARDQLPVKEEGPDILYATVSLREFSTLYSYVGDSAIFGLSALFAVVGLRRKKVGVK
jgi:apolipoprotein N-acyltransferase